MDLFEVKETLSPRLAWMQENGVATHYSEAKWFASESKVPEACGSFNQQELAKQKIGVGETEEEALFDLVSITELEDWRK